MNKINYKEAIKRPFTDFNKFLIGVVLLLIPILNIITGFVVRGYQLSCSKDLKKTKYKLPDWKYFKNYFVIGIFSFLISLIYLLPSLITLIISLKNFILTIISSTEFNLEALMSSITGAEVTGVIIATVLVVLTSYVLPIALLEYLKDYKFKDAFKINTIIKKAFTGKYLGTVLVIVIYYIFLYAIFSIILTLVNLIPIAIVSQIISIILSSIISFIIGVTAFTLIGEVYVKLK